MPCFLNRIGSGLSCITVSSLICCDFFSLQQCINFHAFHHCLHFLLFPHSGFGSDPDDRRLMSTGWTKIEHSCSPGALSILYYIPSPLRRSAPSLMLFLSACLAFPLTVLQHGGSIWKCFPEGSGGCCSQGPCWLRTCRTVISISPMATIGRCQPHVIFKP